MLGEPASGVRVAIVLPDLLETHDVGVQLVEPGHDLVSTLPPPSTDQRIDIELHDPQHPLGHTHTLPVMTAAPPARSGAEAHQRGVREERGTTRAAASGNAGCPARPLTRRSISITLGDASGLTVATVGRSRWPERTCSSGTSLLELGLLTDDMSPGSEPRRSCTLRVVRRRRLVEDREVRRWVGVAS